MTEQNIPERITRPLPERTLQAIQTWNDCGYKVVTHGESPETAIVGEFHFDIAAKAKQQELLRILKPDYVLHELARGLIYNPKTRIFHRQIGRTHDELGQSVGDELKDLANSLNFTIVGCDLTTTDVTKAYPVVARRHP